MPDGMLAWEHSQGPVLGESLDHFLKGHDVCLWRMAGSAFFYQKALVIRISPVTEERVWRKKHRHSHVPSVNLGSVICGFFRKTENICYEMLSFLHRENILSSGQFIPFYISFRTEYAAICNDTSAWNKKQNKT